jgi:nucleoid DNA-binding protein
MKKPEIARQVARRTGVSPAEAADRLDWAVHQIIHHLRSGKPSNLSKMGRFSRGEGGKIAFEREQGERP